MGCGASTARPSASGARVAAAPERARAAGHGESGAAGAHHAAPAAAESAHAPTAIASGQRAPRGNSDRSDVSSGSAGSLSSSSTAGKLITDRFQLGRVLGRGGFGEVCEAARRSDGRRCAVKIISKAKFVGEEERALMLLEARLHGSASGHANVCTLLEWVEDAASFAMALELCSGGDVMDAISRASHFSERVASRFFAQMVAAVTHCHAHGVVHRDIKPDNFLLAPTDEEGSGGGAAGGAAVIKLTDFGLSAPAPAPGHFLSDACGSAYYIAPEVLARR
jgi:calcium-dependent protein kinase